jgi:hypothetical protein
MKKIFFGYICKARILFLGLLILSSCIEEGENEIDGKGNNFLRIVASADADSKINLGSSAFNASPGTSTFLQIRRDVVSGGELAKPATIKFTIDNSIVDKYNAYVDEYNAYVDEYNSDLDKDDDGVEEAEELEHKEHHNILSADYYTLSSTTVDFASGEFAKEIPMTLNPTDLSFLEKYSLGVKITEAPSNYIFTSEGNDVLVQVIIKNPYHGVYLAEGVFIHPTAGERPIKRDKDLLTTGPNSVITELGDLGGAGYQMTLTVNTDNTVTITPAGVTPNVDQSYGSNFYDPETNKFHLHYAYNTAAPRIIKEVLTLK